MKENSFIVLTLHSIFTFASVTCTSSLAAPPPYDRLGVQTGDSATYSYDVTSHMGFSWSIHSENVTGTTVEANITLYNPNQTINHTDLSSYNVSRGESNIWWFLICSNLTPPQVIYIGAPSLFRISEEKSMIVLGVNRTVNHMNLTAPPVTWNLYWDNSTGIMVKFRYYSGTGWENLTLTSTSLWGGGGLFGLGTTTWLLIGGVAAVIIVAGAAPMLRGRGKHKSR